MKNTLFSNGLAIISFITAGLALTTNAKIQGHGHLHGDIFGRIVHKSKASSWSSSNATTLGAPDSQMFHVVSPCVAVLNNPTESATILSTATGISGGPDCFGENCVPGNATDHSHPPKHSTPVPQVPVPTLEAQDGPFAGLPGRRRNRYLTSQTPDKVERSPITVLGSGSTEIRLAKTSGTNLSVYLLTTKLIRVPLRSCTCRDPS